MKNMGISPEKVPPRWTQAANRPHPEWEKRRMLNRIPVKTYLLQLGLALGKGVLLQDHRKVFWCCKHQCIITPMHLHSCSNFKIDHQTIRFIQGAIKRGKYDLEKEELLELLRKLEDINCQILDAICGEKVKKVLKKDATQNLKV